MTEGALALRRYLDSRRVSVPAFCSEHDIDRIQLQRMLNGERPRVPLKVAALVARATRGAIPMILWAESPRASVA